MRNTLTPILILGLTALCLSARGQSPLESAKEKFQAELAKVDSSYADAESKRLLVGAIDRLNKLTKGFQQQGDFKSIKQVQTELKRLEASKTVGAADLVAGPAALRQIQEQFIAATKAIQSESLRRKAAVQQRYQSGLLAYQKKITKEGDFKTAEAIEKELNRIGSLSAAAPTPVAAAPRPAPSGSRHLGNGFYEFRGHVYRLMGHESESFFGAMTRAKALGGELACLETDDEFRFAGNLIGHAPVFVGLESVDGNYQWVNGQRLRVQDAWAPGHPMKGNAILLAPDSRLAKTRGSARRLVKIDVRGVPRASFLVEWPSRAASAVAVKTLHEEISRVQRRGKTHAGKTYTMITIPMYPREAMDYCKSLGGQMAVPENKVEQDFLTQGLKDRIWLGISDDTAEGDWRTADGRKITFTAWGHGEPSNLDDEEHHAGILPDAGAGYPWFDAPHTHDKYPFYCRW